MKFRTEIHSTRDVDIYGLGEDEYVESARFVIEWEIDIETREWGIKDFSPSVTNVTGKYLVQIIDGDTEREETREFDFEPYRENCKFAAEFTEFRQLSISNIEIDLDAKTLEVS